MSSITFSTRSDEVRLRGPERYHMGHIVNSIFAGLLTDDLDELNKVCDIGHFYMSQYKTLMDRQQYREAGDQERFIKQTIHTGINVGFRTKLNTENGPVDPWAVQLNTALAYGSDPIKLMAYIHGQCEIHLWVAGKNRAWMANIIEKGLQEKIYRKDMGWEGVVELLKLSLIHI